MTIKNEDILKRLNFTKKGYTRIIDINTDEKMDLLR